MSDTTDIRAIFQLRVPVIVRLGHRRMNTGEVMELGPGSILELPKAFDEPLDLMINNKMIGKGNAVKIGENFGLRITEVGDMEERVLAMGSGRDEDVVATTD